MGELENYTKKPADSQEEAHGDANGEMFNQHSTPEHYSNVPQTIEPAFQNNIGNNSFNPVSGSQLQSGVEDEDKKFDSPVSHPSSSSLPPSVAPSTSIISETMRNDADSESLPISPPPKQDNAVTGSINAKPASNNLENSLGKSPTMSAAPLSIQPPPIRKTPMAKTTKKAANTMSTNFLDSLISEAKPDEVDEEESKIFDTMPPPTASAGLPPSQGPPSSFNAPPSKADDGNKFEPSSIPPISSNPELKTTSSSELSKKQPQPKVNYFEASIAGPFGQESQGERNPEPEVSALADSSSDVFSNKVLEAPMSSSPFTDESVFSSNDQFQQDSDFAIPPAFDSAPISSQPADKSSNMEEPKEKSESVSNKQASPLPNSEPQTSNFFDQLQSNNSKPDYQAPSKPSDVTPASSLSFSEVPSVASPAIIKSQDNGHNGSKLSHSQFQENTPKPTEDTFKPTAFGSNDNLSPFDSIANDDSFLENLAQPDTTALNSAKEQTNEPATSLFGNSSDLFLEEIKPDQNQSQSKPEANPDLSVLASLLDDTTSTDNDFFSAIAKDSAPVNETSDLSKESNLSNTNAKEVSNSSLFDKLGSENTHSQEQHSVVNNSQKEQTKEVPAVHSKPESSVFPSSTTSTDDTFLQSINANETHAAKENLFLQPEVHIAATSGSKNATEDSFLAAISNAETKDSNNTAPSATENNPSYFGDSNDCNFMSAINSGKEDLFLSDIDNNQTGNTQQQSNSNSSSSKSQPFGNTDVEDEFSKLLTCNSLEQKTASNNGSKDLSASFAFLDEDDDLLPDDFSQPSFSAPSHSFSQPQRPKTVDPNSGNKYAPAKFNNQYAPASGIQQPPRSHSAMKEFNTATNSFDLPTAMVPKVKRMTSFSTQQNMANTMTPNFQPHSQFQAKPPSPKAQVKKSSFFEELPLAPSRVIAKKQSFANANLPQSSMPNLPGSRLSAHEPLGQPQISSPPVNPYAQLAGHASRNSSGPNQQQPGYPYSSSATPQPGNPYNPSGTPQPAGQNALPNRYAPSSAPCAIPQQLSNNQYAPSSAPQQQPPNSQYAPLSAQQQPPNAPYAPSSAPQQPPHDPYAPNHLGGPPPRSSLSRNTNPYGPTPVSPNSAQHKPPSISLPTQQLDPYHRSSVTAPPQYPLSSIQPQSHPGQPPFPTHQSSHSGSYNQYQPRASSPLAHTTVLQPSAPITQSKPPVSSHKSAQAYGDMPMDIGARSVEAYRSPQAQQAIFQAKQMRSPHDSNFGQNPVNQPPMGLPLQSSDNAQARYRSNSAGYAPQGDMYGPSESFGMPSQQQQQYQNQQPPAPRVNPETLLKRQFPLFCWGNGNKAVVGVPSAMSFGGNSAVSEIKLVDVTQALYPESTAKFPASIMSAKGPNKGKKKEIEKWIEEHVKDLDFRVTRLPPAEAVRYSDRSILWKILLILLKGDASPAKLGPKFVGEICELLDPTAMKKAPDGASAQTAHDMYKQNHAISSNSRSVQTDDINGIVDLLKVGDREQALQYALDRGFWAHALILASSIGADKWTQTVSEFVRQDIRPFPTQSAKSLAYMFRLFAGSKADSVSEILPNNMVLNYKLPDPSNELNAALRDWKSIAALSFANYSPVCTEAIETLSSLLLNSGYVEAAHTLNILFNPSSFGPGIIPGKNTIGPSSFLLLGSQNGRDTEAILLSMVYEFYRCSTDSPAPTPFGHLLPFKLNYAAYLADYGKITDSRALYDSITGFIKSHPKSPAITRSLLKQIDSLGYRLNFMPEDANASWFSGKLARPKFDQVLGHLDKSLTKFISGEEVPTEEQAKQDGGIFKKLAETPSASFVDLPSAMPPSRTQSSIGFQMDNANMALPPRSGSGPMTGFPQSHNRPMSPYYPPSDGGFRSGSTDPIRSRRSSVNTRTSATPDRVLSPALSSSSDLRYGGIVGIPENQPLKTATSPGRSKSYAAVGSQLSPPKPVKSASVSNNFSPGSAPNKYGSTANLRKNIYAPKDSDTPAPNYKPQPHTSLSSPYAPVSSDPEPLKKKSPTNYAPRSSTGVSPKAGATSVGSVSSSSSLPPSPMPLNASIARNMTATPENMYAGKPSHLSPASSENQGPQPMSPSLRSQHSNAGASPRNSVPYDSPYSYSRSNPSRPSGRYAPTPDTGLDLPTARTGDDSQVSGDDSYMPLKDSLMDSGRPEPSFKRGPNAFDSAMDPEQDDFEENEDQEAPPPPPPPPMSKLPVAPKNPYDFSAPNPASKPKPTKSAYNPYAPAPSSKPAASAKTYDPYAPISSSEKKEDKVEAKDHSASSVSAPAPFYGGYNPYGPYGYDNTPANSNENENDNEESSGVRDTKPQKPNSTYQDDENTHHDRVKQNDNESDAESDGDSYAPYEPPQYGYSNYNDDEQDMNDDLPLPPPVGNSVYGAVGGFSAEAAASSSSLYVPMGTPTFTPSASYSKAVPLAHTSVTSLALDQGEDKNRNKYEIEKEKEKEDEKEKESIKQDTKATTPKSNNDASEDEEYDEADDFLGGGPSKKKQNKPKKEAKKPADKSGGSNDGEKAGWFGWLSRKDEGPKPIKAKLGDDNSFYYDPKLKRWIDKKRPLEEQIKASTIAPPPPGGRMTPALLSKPGTPAPMPMSSPGSGPRPLGGSPGMVPPAPGVIPPSKPGTPVPMSFPGGNSDGIDDLLAAAPTTARKKRNARSRYIDVMNPTT